MKVLSHVLAVVLLRQGEESVVRVAEAKVEGLPGLQGQANQGAVQDPQAVRD